MKWGRLIVVLLAGTVVGCGGDDARIVSQPLGRLDSGAQVSLQHSTRVPINENVCVPCRDERSACPGPSA